MPGAKRPPPRGGTTWGGRAWSTPRGAKRTPGPVTRCPECGSIVILPVQGSGGRSVYCRDCGWSGPANTGASTRGNIRTAVEIRGSTYKFKSRAEARYALEVLEPYLFAGVVKAWLYERPLDLIVHGGTREVIRRYRPDFTLLMPDGTTELHEVKGYEEQHYQILRDVLTAIWLPQHPGYRYCVLDSKTLTLRQEWP